MAAKIADSQIKIYKTRGTINAFLGLFIILVTVILTIIMYTAVQLYRSSIAQEDSVRLAARNLDYSERNFGQITRWSLYALVELSCETINIGRLEQVRASLNITAQRIQLPMFRDLYNGSLKADIDGLATIILNDVDPKLNAIIAAPQDAALNSALRSDATNSALRIEQATNEVLLKAEFVRKEQAAELIEITHRSSDRTRESFTFLAGAVLLFIIMALFTGAGVASFFSQRERARLALEQLNQHLEARIHERTAAAEAAAAEAQRASQVRSLFLANVSHELRTPLNPILNFAHAVASGMLGPVTPEQVDALGIVTLSGEHLLSLINDALDITKIESGQLALYVESGIDLYREMQIVIHAAESMLKDKPAVQLEIDIPDTLPLITGDKRRIRQIFLNLVSNACNYTEQGRVMFRLMRVGDDILGVVADTGPGISALEVESAFQNFQQTENGLRKGMGTGLGLPIAHYLAEAHCGRLWLESRVGVGTTFFVSLPIYSSLAAGVVRSPEVTQIG